ncbi:MAG: primosomal protein [Nostoc sp. DedQUE05]|uniref:primosomal protein n=1 Tax=Nostoc sp. DedQUE05 TaxID=3075391 RepID=UPI002AD577C1|nr:primosomal protein [Nostoc sp. DedQUE05]MDZ8091552.1 primosomal protein [Nostoc sp. DedQUE05]
MAIAKARTNNNRNAVNAKTSAKTNGASATTKSKVANASPQEEALALLKELRNLIFKEYGVKLQLRDSRVSTKIGHAAREKLGLDIAAQVKKKGGNKKFDWQKWNTKLFTKLFGQPDALKYAPEVVAIFMSMLYDTISTDPEQAIADLVEFNRASLERRNSFQEQEEEELDDLDDELDEDLDEDEEDIEDELDEDLDEDDELDEEDEEDEDE